jgi:hypothetical protein
MINRSVVAAGINTTNQLLLQGSIESTGWSEITVLKNTYRRRYVVNAGSNNYKLVLSSTVVLLSIWHGISAVS